MCVLVALPATLCAQSKADADREPPGAKALSADCKAPRAFAKEIRRLLEVAAGHSTHSRACADGPGHRFTVSDVRVCPIKKKKRSGEVEFRASYVVAEFAEGDTRMCGRMNNIQGDRLDKASEKNADPNYGLPDLCSGRPRVERFQAQFTFRKKSKGKKTGMRLYVPSAIPGFPPFGRPKDPVSLKPTATALNKEHNGGCYGKSGPFIPKRIRF